MPLNLPPSFSSTEHLQDQVKRLVNKSVNRYFRDLGGDDWQPPAELGNNSRASLRLACTHLENDNIGETMTRLFLYYQVVRRDELVETAMYGIPIPGYQASVRFLPQINLQFKEKPEDVAAGESPITGDISFRFKEDDLKTDADLTAIGRKIKSVFGGSTPNPWQKGRDCMAYHDKDREPPLQLKIYCASKADGREMVSKVFQVLDGSPDWSKAHFSQNEDDTTAYPIIPKTKSVLGKSRKLPRRRPRARVYLTHASCHLHGLPNPIIVYDRSGRFRNALVTENRP